MPRLTALHYMLSINTYELWDLKTRNLVGGYETEAAALAVVRRTIDAYGRTFVDELALVRENSPGRTKTIARGPALADRALAAEPFGKDTGDWPSLTWGQRHRRRPSNAGQPIVLRRRPLDEQWRGRGKGTHLSRRPRLRRAERRARPPRHIR
ncbi:MAG: hypothetical protein ACRDJN_25100, partial [Chloroflexota bacterium]